MEAQYRAQQQMSGLAERLCFLAAGCEVDENAVRDRDVDLATLRKLGEAFRTGWLHNIMSRITPLTVRQKEDYVAMADIFIPTEKDAIAMLERYDADLELFCSMAEIKVTKHMTSKTASQEIKAHVALYDAVAGVFRDKFGLDWHDPVQNLAQNPIMSDETNPFIKDFVSRKFKRKN